MSITFPVLGIRGFRECTHCGASVKLLRCAGCQSAHYCNKECQSLDWKNHKKVCAIAAICSLGAYFHRALRPQNGRIVPSPHYREAPSEIWVCERVQQCVLSGKLLGSPLGGPSCAHCSRCAAVDDVTAQCTGCARPDVYQAYVSHNKCLGSALQSIKGPQAAACASDPSLRVGGLVTTLECSQKAASELMVLVTAEPCRRRRLHLQELLVKTLEIGLCAIQELYTLCEETGPSGSKHPNCNYQMFMQGCLQIWPNLRMSRTVPDLRDLSELCALHEVTLRALHVVAFRYTRGFLKLRKPLCDYCNPYGRLLEGLSWSVGHSPAPARPGLYDILFGVAAAALPMLWRVLHMTAGRACSPKFAIALVRTQALHLEAFLNWSAGRPADIGPQGQAVVAHTFRERAHFMAAEGRAMAQELIDKCPQLMKLFQGPLVFADLVLFNRVLNT